MKNKKYIALPIMLFLVIVIAFTACKKNGAEPIIVTDPNGTPLTDVNGEKITVVPETEYETVTDEKGEPVTEKDGEVKTTVKYKPQDVAIPVTNEKGEAVTNSDGEVLTTMIVVPAETTTGIVIDVPLTDDKGVIVTTPDGEIVSTTVVIDSNNPQDIPKPVTKPNGDYVTDESGNIETSVTKPVLPDQKPNNNILYTKTFGGEKFDRTVASVATPDGGYVAAIKTNSTTGDFATPTKNISTGLAKFDKQGNIVWKKVLSGNDAVTINSIALAPDGNIIVAGETRATDFVKIHYFEFEAFIAKYTLDGEQVFITPWGGTSNESFFGVDTDSNGNIYAVGFAYSQDGDCASLKIPKNQSNAVIVKFDKNGKAIASKGFGGFGDNFTGISISNNNEIYVCGSFISGKLFPNRGYADSAVFAFDTSLNEKANHLWGGSGVDYLPKIKALNDGGFVVAGSSNSLDGDLEKVGNKGGHDAIILKYSKDCGLVWARAFAGSNEEKFLDIAITPENNIIAVGYGLSNNRDFKFIGNLGGKDAFIVKFSGDTGSVIEKQGFSGSRDETFNTVSVLSDGRVMVGGSTLSTDGYYSNCTPKSDGKNHIATVVVFRI